MRRLKLSRNWKSGSEISELRKELAKRYRGE